MDACTEGKFMALCTHLIGWDGTFVNVAQALGLGGPTLPPGPRLGGTDRHTLRLRPRHRGREGGERGGGGGGNAVRNARRVGERESERRGV